MDGAALNQSGKGSGGALGSSGSFERYEFAPKGTPISGTWVRVGIAMRMIMVIGAGVVKIWVGQRFFDLLLKICAGRNGESESTDAKSQLQMDQLFFDSKKL
jgi:hypothetical protein